MSSAPGRFDTLIDALKEREFRLTPQRIELVRLIAASDGHPSALQLHARIRSRFPTMSQATVCKTLALLKDMEQVLEIGLRDDSRYDGHRPSPHSHLVCTNCNKIVDGELDLAQPSIRRLEQASGFQGLRPQIVLYGLCPTCKQGRT